MPHRSSSNLVAEKFEESRSSTRTYRDMTLAFTGAPCGEG
jgi:hypothetical protein